MGAPDLGLEAALAPLTADPSRSAILLDVDGTLAPIVRDATAAHVPEAVRGRLIAVAERYGLVACVSGRRAAEARRIVGLGTIAYVGNHGAEILLGRQTQPEVDPEVEAWQRRVQEFDRRIWQEFDLERLRVRGEDKQLIVSYHWRGVPEVEEAEAAIREVGAQAEAAGLRTHWGRMVLEVRPDVSFDKGKGVDRLLRDADVDAALYIGDDRTDVDAFVALRDAVSAGRLGAAVCIGVASEETPPEVAAEADLLVDGPDGVRATLALLASA